MSTTRTAYPLSAGWVLCALQFVFTLGWTVYVIFLPGLMAQAGIDKRWVLWILLADQLVFTLMDLATGAAADRVARKLGRLGPWVLSISGLSALAFLSMPWISQLLPQDLQAATLLGLIALWTLTSSALRAPPLVLLAKYASAPQTRQMLAIYLTGLALAGAAAPYLTVMLKNLSPQLPFALASLSLIFTVMGLVHVERQLASQRAPSPHKRAGATPWNLWLAVLLLGAAFQNHFVLNAANQFLRFIKPPDLEWLMPVFWIGFNVMLFGTSPLAKRYGSWQTMAAAALVSAIASFACALAPNLNTLVAAQIVAGAAWGTLFISGIEYALFQGKSGREGLYLGGFFSMLALATVARIGLAIAGLPKSPEWQLVFPWSPIALWLVGAALLLVWARRSRDS